MWDAAAMATCSPRSAAPAFMAATAWNGLSVERGKISSSGAPTERATEPSGASTTAEPRWRDSTKPLRCTTARSTA